MLEVESNIKEIIDKFSSLIRYVILKNLHKTDDVDLEDIEQEVKLRIWKFIKKGKIVEKLPSYIKRVAYTVTVDELRKMRKQCPARQSNILKNIYLFSNSVINEKGINSPERLLEEKELILSLRELIGRLSNNRKQVLKLYLKGMSIEEICELFNWDKTKVRHLLYRGINDIKEKIKDDRNSSCQTQKLKDFKQKDYRQMRRLQ